MNHDSDYHKAACKLRAAGFTVSPVIGSAGADITAHDGANAVSMKLTEVDGFIDENVATHEAAQ